MKICLKKFHSVTDLKKNRTIKSKAEKKSSSTGVKNVPKEENIRNCASVKGIHSITAQSIWSEINLKKLEGSFPLKYAILSFGKCLNY